MKARSHAMPAACPAASSLAHLVQIEVSPSHPLLLLQQALPWEALSEVRTRHWRQHGKHVDGRRGLPWEVSFDVPLVVLMLRKGFDARQREASVAENVVARVFLGRPHDSKAQMRDHATIARAYAARGKEGLNDVHTLVVQEAHGVGFVDEGVGSAAPTAQELPLGSPNEPGILRGLAQRCGRALRPLRQRGGQGLDGALEQVQTIVRSVQEHQRFPAGKGQQRQGLTRILREGGALMGQTRPLVKALSAWSQRGIQSARARQLALHAVSKPLLGPMVHWLSTGQVAAHKIVPVGIPQARAIVRNQAGKQTECGLASLSRRRGGG